MAQEMVTTPIQADIIQPQPGKTSRSLPDQVGNVAGANSEELTDRIIATSARAAMPGPLKEVVVFWLGGMSCDGCTISTLGATEPAVEELLTGSIPGVPTVALHHYAASVESGDHFTRSLELAAKGELGVPFVIVFEGSVPDENLTLSGEPWAAEGALPLFAPFEERERIPSAVWLQEMAPHAAAVIAIGTCATWGGIPGSAGNPTGSMSVMDFLGKNYRSVFGLPVVNVPGCAPCGDNFTETVAMTLLFLNKQAPLPEFDELGRPLWQFVDTVHRRCPRGGWYEEGTFAIEYGDKECLVELGCWGPVVNCNITERGAVGHMGGCMVAGGACIGCTMPGFPDKFAPFYKKGPGSTVSTTFSRTSGAFIRPLRRISQLDRNREPRWHTRTPSGWAMQYDAPSLFDRFIDFFYYKLQYLGGERPGRQKPVEKYPSGYITPAEAAYGEKINVLPDERLKIAKKRGLPQREGFSPQAHASAALPSSAAQPENETKSGEEK